MSENTTAIAPFEENTQPLVAGNIWDNPSAFNVALRMANAMAASTIIPKDYQGNASNTLIAIEMASRLGTSPMQVMQNLFVINGRPSWSSQYIIAVINSSKKYKHELKFELTGTGDNMQCYAWTTDRDGKEIRGPIISMQMAKDEGWVQKNGSKWKTMPEVMIRYRAASFFGRLYCSDMIMGIYSQEEVYELDESDYYISTQESAETTIARNANAEVIDANVVTSNEPADPSPTPIVDESTGEVIEPSVSASENPQATPPEGQQAMPGYERKF
jgi:hypothetical protein